METGVSRSVLSVGQHHKAVFCEYLPRLEEMMHRKAHAQCQLVDVFLLF